MNLLQQPLILPNGSKLQNRLAKSAMSENFALPNHAPNRRFFQLYDRWVKGGAGLLISGNIMIDSRALGEPRNVVVEDESHIEEIKKWTSCIQGTQTHLWAQINHPGRQAFQSINRETVAPSAVAVKIKGTKSLFSTPRALSGEEVWDLVERFGRTAFLLKKGGFTGVQIHAAHGYLISQFLSPLTNLRKDEWGGDIYGRAKFLLEVFRCIRQKVGPQFPIGVKINSADFQRGGFSQEDSMEVLKILSKEGIDLIEISGGSYERPAMVGSHQKESTRQREAYFMEYVEKARHLIDKPLMLTGGFRSLKGMEEAIEQNKLDLIGLARPFAVYPNIAHELLEESIVKIHLPNPKTGIAFLDKMRVLDLIWYEKQMGRLADGKEPNLNQGLWGILAGYAKMALEKSLRKN